MPSRDLVLKKLHEHFPDLLIATQALESLDRYGDRDWHRAKELVHLAIIKLSAGRLCSLREQVEAARKDFRDVLVQALQPEQWQHTKKVRPTYMRRLKVKPLSAANQASMERRDLVQWERWLTSAVS